MLMLLWSQFSIAMPPIHEHIEQVEVALHAAVNSDVVMLPNAEHAHEDGSEHEPHVHACGGHVTAVPLSLEFHTQLSSAVYITQATDFIPTRSPERLLRPPKA